MKSAVAAALLFAVATQQNPQLDRLLAELSAYLDAYEGELSTVVAEERLTQEIVPLRRLTETQQRRALLSDVTFMRLPGDGPWLGYREVKRVDNLDLARSAPALVELFARPDSETARLAQKIAVASAKWNLGAVRTINMPAVVLELAHRRNRDRFAYRLRGTDRIDGARVMRVDFKEHATPSLIRSPDGEVDLLSEGALYVEPGSGRVWRAEVKSQATRANWKYEVTFALHNDLGMLVPIRSREEFFVPRGKGVGTARYSKFRRYTTSGRILPQ